MLRCPTQEIRAGVFLLLGRPGVSGISASIARVRDAEVWARVGLVDGGGADFVGAVDGFGVCFWEGGGRWGWGGEA